MPAGHAPFAIWNRSGNRAIASLLRSPAHPLLSGQLTLITVTGRRSGREHTLPVAYKQDGEHLKIPVMWPERKLWWRNLRDGAEVRLRHCGADRTGRAQAVGDEHSGVSVAVQLDAR
jgi:hypothetical protein